MDGVDGQVQGVSLTTAKLLSFDMFHARMIEEAPALRGIDIDCVLSSSLDEFDLVRIRLAADRIAAVEARLEVEWPTATLRGIYRRYVASVTDDLLSRR